MFSGGRIMQRTKARTTPRQLLWPLVAVVLSVCLLLRHFVYATKAPSTPQTRPLLKQHIDYGTGAGGRWYIPESWVQEANIHTVDGHSLISSNDPQNVLEAAQLALELCLLNSRFVQHSKIPLIAHQTWKNTDSNSWPEVVRESVDSWLDAATGETDVHSPEMAYVFWDDVGIDMLMKEYEFGLWSDFQHLPYKVEKADTFRVAVLRWFGGVYSDVDIKLLQHPYHWIQRQDVADWQDSETHSSYQLQMPRSKRYQVPMTSPTPYQEIMEKLKPSGADVGAIFGLEADNPADTDDYWRMGYTYPVQLTNWAFAMVPQHPTASRYLSNLSQDIRSNSSRLSNIDPLDLTGPPALTKAVKAHSENMSPPEFRWSALSGRKDVRGGRGKVVASDVLILPITGFSPGRGWFHNMGSQPITHPNARLLHCAQGSWRRISLKVHMGKFCRTFLGGCRDWKKIP